MIGRGQGETVVIDLPDGSIGVIDPHCRDKVEDPSDHPIVRFVCTGAREAARIRFVALTHPHLDHIFGAASFCQSMTSRIDNVWLCGGWDIGKMREYLHCVMEQPQDSLDGDYVARELIDEESTRAKEMRAVDDWITESDVKCATVENNVSVSVCKDPDVHARWFAPTRSSMRGLATSLERILQQGRRDGDSIKIPLNALHKRVRWNELSTVMLLWWGNVQVLLCGDAETSTWDSILGTTAQPQEPDENPPWNPQYVKIGHHGSITGLNDRLYPYMAQNGNAKPWGVLTPFTRSRLPSVEGVNAHGTRLDQVYTTHRTASEHAGTWRHGLGSQDAAGLLADPQRMDTKQYQSVVVGRDADISISPRDAGEVGIAHGKAAVEDLYRVSIYFDVDGNPVDSQGRAMTEAEMGDGAGRLR